MPIITKQIAPINGPAKVAPKLQPSGLVPTGSLLSRAVPVSVVDDEWMKILLYGVNRSGKTKLACQFPKPLLLISVEPGKQGGSRSVHSELGVVYLRLTSTAECHELADLLATCNICDLTRLKNEKGGFNSPADRKNHELHHGKKFLTHVFDGITSLQDVALMEILGLDKPLVQNAFGAVTEDQYRERSDIARRVIQKYRDAEGVHTVFIGLEKDHNPPEGRRRIFKPGDNGGLNLETYLAADVGQATMKWLQNACDIVRLYLHKETKSTQMVGPDGQPVEGMQSEEETGRQVRRCRLTPHNNISAGLRVDGLDTPDFIEADKPTEMYKKLMAVIKGGKP